MQPPICNPKPQNHLEFLKPLLNDSIKQFLVQYRTGRTHFSDFDSIFTRILHDLPDPPPLELVWFYSAIRFHSSKLDFEDDSVRLTSSFFQLLVSLSDSFSGVKRIALLSPIVYQLSRLVNTKRRDALSLLDGIVSYISMYVDESGGVDDLVMVSGFSFADLIRVWVVDEVDEDCRVEDCLEIFMPFVGERLHKEMMDFESCTVGYLAGIVASQAFLLSLCLRFDSELSRSDSEVEKDMRESVIQMISGFQSCYFFDVILKMLLLEPSLHLSTLLGAEDEATLTKIIREAVIESVEKLFINSENGTLQRSLQLKNIAINWLFLVNNSMDSLRRNKEQEEETSRYMNMFSNSRIPYHLINWLISQGEVIRDADTLLDMTPASFIEWLVTLEDQGLRVFGCDQSKTYAKTVIQRSRPNFNLEATLLKQQEEIGQDADMADDHIVSSISILRSSGTRKRKEARHDNKEGETKVKIFKRRHGNFLENSKFQPFGFSDNLVNGTEVEVSDMEL